MAHPLATFLILMPTPVSFQVEVMKQAHIRGLLKAFLVPTRSMLQTQHQAEEQASKSPLPLPWSLFPLSVSNHGP